MNEIALITPLHIDIHAKVNLHGGWGIELLVQSKGMEDHVSRFDPTTTPASKYVRLGVKDHTVIDFRNSSGGEEGRVNIYKKAITVFFPKTTVNGFLSLVSFFCARALFPEKISLSW
jgi:hypothetical protein